VKQFFLLLTSLAFLTVSAYGQSVHEKSGNIYFTDSAGREIQLTSSGCDSSPSLSPNGRLIVFVRTTPYEKIDAGAGEVDHTELWIMNLGTKKAERLLGSKDAADPKDILVGFAVPQFSNNSKEIYFMSAAWATSSAVHRLDLQTKSEKFISSGNSLKVIRTGKFKGNLRINKHKYYKEGGSYDCDYIVTPSGKEIKIIEDSCDGKPPRSR
jgi:Tol biopolymer transport system component